MMVAGFRASPSTTGSSRPLHHHRRAARTQTTALFGSDSARPADNHTVIIEFRVDDVDRE
jgi:hypothetical protein